MDKWDLRARTKAFSLCVVRLFQKLPQRTDAAVIGKQLLRCATSVGANYRAASIAKSKADFVAKIKICEEEADECEYWLELLEEANIIAPADVLAMKREARELANIFAASAKTARNSSQI